MSELKIFPMANGDYQVESNNKTSYIDKEVFDLLETLSNQLAEAKIELDVTYDFYSRLVDVVPKDAVHIYGLRREDLADYLIKKLKEQG